MDWEEHDAHGHRRRFSRRPVHLPATLHVGEAELPAATENISPGGAFIAGALPAAATEVVAAIRLPQGRSLVVRAKVRWRRLDPPGIGVEFKTFLPGALKSELADVLG